MKKFTILLPILMALLVACNSETANTETVEKDTAISEEEIQLVEDDNTQALNEELMGLFELTMINQPLPLNIIEAIDQYDGEHSLTIEAPKTASEILGSYNKNIALGIYGAQLIYTIEKEKYSGIPSLLNEVNTLTTEIGFPELINPKTMEQYEVYKDNKDSLRMLAITTFESLSSQLRNNGQIEQATLIMATGKIESIKLAVISINNAEKKAELKEEAIKESNSLSELLLILEEFKSDESIQKFLLEAKNFQLELNKEELNIEYFQNLSL